MYSEIVRKVDPMLITSLDPREIANKAIKLNKDINLLQKLGKKCKQIAKLYTKEKSVNEFKDKFNQIIKKTK